MSVYTNTLAKFAFVHAIAANTIKDMDAGSAEFQLLVDLKVAAQEALVLWPGGKLDRNTVGKLNKRMHKFTARVEWEYTPVHIQSMVNFSLSQMVDLLENHIVEENRKRLVLQVGAVLQAVYMAYSKAPEDHERPECIDEGEYAAQIWKEIMES